VSIVAIAGLKGGSGKSSITANLASEMVALGRSVIVIDCDPQQSLVHWAALGTGLLSQVVEAVDTARPAQFNSRVQAANRAADRVLLDCPPGFADPALLAALLADVLLLPACPSPIDILAAAEALESAREARAQRGGRKPVIRFVPSKIQVATNSGRDLSKALEGIGEKVLPAIGLRIAVSDSAIDGQTVREYAPHSSAAAEFRALALAVEKIL